MQCARLLRHGRRISPRREHIRYLSGDRRLDFRHRNRVPRWIYRQVAPEHIGMRKTSFATNAVTLPDQTTDLDVRKPIKIGSNARQLPLHFGMQRGWIPPGIDKIGNPSEEKPGSVLKRFILQLPDSIHENVTGAHSSAKDSTGPQIATDFERFAYIADKHAIPRRLVCFRQLRAIAIERTKLPFADIRGENVQTRVFRQLEQTRVAVKIFLVVVLQEPNTREL